MENHITAANNIYSPEQQQEIKDDGYKAHVSGKDMSSNNPYSEDDCRYWVWRSGYLEAFKDANGM